jgi:hypothetical protein
VAVTSTGIRIREHISRPDGSQTAVSIDAQFDGNDHPVTGSPIIDTIVYTRTAPNRIVATGKNNGIVTLTEVISAGPDGQGMMLIYVIYRGSQPVATGTAVFHKSHPVF